MKHDTDVHVKDSTGHSALFYALHSTTLSIPLIKRILKSGIATFSFNIIGNNESTIDKQNEVNDIKYAFLVVFVITF
jgi:hypothetical protein